MLTKEDKYEIIELRGQIFSYQAIHEKLGFAVQTIMNVCKEENERKIIEIKQRQRESKKVDESRTQKGAVSFFSSIQVIQEISSDIDNVIKHGQLKIEDRREWEKRKEDLLELLRVEVDDRIAEEIAAAVETRDEVWREFLKQNYVKKEVAKDINNTIKTKDSLIEDLRTEVVQKDNLLRNKQYEISQLNASHQLEKEDLNNRIGDLLFENIGLKEEIGDLSDFIGNYIDDAGRREREELRREEDLIVKKTDFDIHIKRQRSNLDRLFVESEETLKSAKKLEEELDEQREKLKKREEKFDKNKKQIYDMLVEKLKAVEKLEEELDERKDELDAEREKIQDDRRKVTKEMDAIRKTAERQRTEEKRLQKWQKHLDKTGGFNKISLPCPHCRKPILFDANEPEINQKIKSLFGNYVHYGCRLKNEQPTLVTLRSVSFSDEPVVRSGFSPVIGSGGEPMVIMSGIKPVVQSGFPSIIQSGE